ncbi:inverse autotransporter beta domain-containing protein [Xenorhabdus bovienii]
MYCGSRCQKNPYSVTAGLTYTSVPLVTLGADFRQGKQESRNLRGWHTVL